MKVDRVQLGSKEILEKEFKTSLRGYDPKEVDEFLDIIMQDYEILNHAYQRLQQENNRLKNSLVQEAEVKQEPKKETPAPKPANYDVLKRLSNLEKAVFGQNSNIEDN